MYFAKIDIFNKVLKVIVADQDYIDTLPGQWVPCDIEGIFPKNYPGVGYTFDANRMAFIPPKPYPSWILDEATCFWSPPTPRPNDGNRYRWDEESQSWILVES